MESEFCDCTRSIKLPGKSLSDELDIPKEEPGNSNSEFIDIGRLKLSRRKQQEGIESLRSLLDNSSREPIIKKEPQVQSADYLDGTDNNSLLLSFIGVL